MSLSSSRMLMPWEKLDEESLKRERILAKHLAKQSREAILAAVHQCVDDAKSDENILER